MSKAFTYVGGSTKVRVRDEKKGTVLRETEQRTPAIASNVEMAHVGVRLGIKRNSNYQSVSLDVSVTLPWAPDDVPAGLVVARDYADAMLAESVVYLEECLSALAAKESR